MLVLAEYFKRGLEAISSLWHVFSIFVYMYYLLYMYIRVHVKLYIYRFVFKFYCCLPYIYVYIVMTIGMVWKGCLLCCIILCSVCLQIMVLQNVNVHVKRLLCDYLLSYIVTVVQLWNVYFYCKFVKSILKVLHNYMTLYMMQYFLRMSSKQLSKQIKFKAIISDFLTFAGIHP